MSVPKARKIYYFWLYIFIQFFRHPLVYCISVFMLFIVRFFQAQLTLFWVRKPYFMLTAAFRTMQIELAVLSFMHIKQSKQDWKVFQSSKLHKKRLTLLIPSFSSYCELKSSTPEATLLAWQPIPSKDLTKLAILSDYGRPWIFYFSIQFKKKKYWVGFCVHQYLARNHSYIT